MILPDLNLLIYAHNTAMRHHPPARAWWEESLSGNEPVALAWLVLIGFIRITTSRAVLVTPWPMDEALGRVESWLDQPHVRLIEPAQGHLSLLSDLLNAAGTAANLTNDAHLAALAIEHGCTIHTTDTDFARFPGLAWRNPLAQ